MFALWTSIKLYAYLWTFPCFLYRDIKLKKKSGVNSADCFPEGLWIQCSQTFWFFKKSWEFFVWNPQVFEFLQLIPKQVFFFLGKTGPELTSVPISLYLIFGTPATAWLAKWCLGRSGMEWVNPGAAEVEHANLPAAPPAWPQNQVFFNCRGLTK